MRAGPSAGHTARRLADRPPSFPFRRYQPEGFACANTLLGHSHFVGAVAAAGTGVASGSNDKHVIEWDVSQGTPMRILEGHTDVVACVRAAPSGDLLFSGSWDKTAKVWQDGQCVRTLKGHEQAVWSVLPLADGRVLTASADRSIKLWEGEACVQTYTGHEDVVRDLALLPNVGFVSASNDGTVRAWELGGECLKVLRASELFVYGVLVLESGEWLTCAEDRTVKVWDAGSGECTQSLSHPSTVWGCAALPNGDVVAGCADGNAYVWTRAAERVASPDLCAAFKERAAGLDEGRPPCLEDGDLMPLCHQPEGSGRSHATQERRWEACRGLRSSPRAAPKG